jgi:hypothetical protein
VDAEFKDVLESGCRKSAQDGKSLLIEIFAFSRVVREILHNKIKSGHRAQD